MCFRQQVGRGLIFLTTLYEEKTTDHISVHI